MFFCVEITRSIPISINEKQCLSVNVNCYALLINYDCDDYSNLYWEKFTLTKPFVKPVN